MPPVAAQHGAQDCFRLGVKAVVKEFAAVIKQIAAAERFFRRPFLVDMQVARAPRLVARKMKDVHIRLHGFSARRHAFVHSADPAKIGAAFHDAFAVERGEGRAFFVERRVVKAHHHIGRLRFEHAFERDEFFGVFGGKAVVGVQP